MESNYREFRKAVARGNKMLPGKRIAIDFSAVLAYEESDTHPEVTLVYYCGLPPFALCVSYEEFDMLMQRYEDDLNNGPDSDPDYDPDDYEPLPSGGVGYSNN